MALTLCTDDRRICFYIDEIYFSQPLTLNIFRDMMIQFVDLGSLGDTNEPTDHTLFFVV